jgi:AraC-like DNA-binding protein
LLLHPAKLVGGGGSWRVLFGKKVVAIGCHPPRHPTARPVLMLPKPAPAIAEYHLNRHQPHQPQLALHDLRTYLQAHGEQASKSHIHSYYQIIWFKQGVGTHFVDFREYEVATNTLFFIAKNQVHRFDSLRAYQGLLLHFNEQFLVQQELDFFLKYNLFNNPYQQSACYLGAAPDHPLDAYIGLLKDELAGGEAFGKETLLMTYLQAFLIQVQRRKSALESREGEPPLHLNEKRLQLLRFVNLVDEYYKTGLTVGEYAQRLLLSPRTLANLTNQLLGKSPSLLVQERLVLEAQRLLVHSTLNVNEIAYQLGFEDASYFVKYFKKHALLSPSAFRKALS